MHGQGLLLPNMKHEIEVLEQGIIFDSPNRIYGYNGWPTIGKSDDGRLILVFSGFRNWHVDPFGQCIMLQSLDDGKTWSLPMVVMNNLLESRDSGFLNIGNGRVMVTSYNAQIERSLEHVRDYPQYLKPYEKLVLAYAEMITTEENTQNSRSFYRISDDNGFTWSDVKFLPVMSPHGPAILENGTIIYAGVRFGLDALNLPPSHSPIVTYVSYDKGESFLAYSEIPVKELEGYKMLFCEPHMIEVAKDHLVCQIRADVLSAPENDKSITKTFQSTSHDGGKTWSVAKLLNNRGTPAHLLKLTDGRVISVYGHRFEPYPRSIMAAISDDLCETWEDDFVLDETPESGDMGYPSTVQLSNGELLTAFYSIRNIDNTSPVRFVRWKLK